MTTQIMVDIETLGVSPNSIILTIAAVKFSFGSNNIETFSININPKSCTKYGLIKEQSTIDWWKDHPEALKKCITNQVDVEESLDRFTQWVGSDKYVWWSNGALDFTLLEWTLKATGRSTPWRYFELRDARTVYALGNLDLKKFPRVGTYHNAIDDCMTQIAALKHCLL